MTLKIKIGKCIEQSSKIFWLVYFCAFCISGIFFTQAGVTDSISEMITLLVTVIGSISVFTWFSKNEKDKTALFFIFFGYIVRVLYRYGTESGILTFSYTSAPSDATHFWITSSNLYFGIHNDIVLTKYPYLLRCFYEVFGNNRYLAEYLNILFWVFSTLILLRLGRATGLAGKEKYILYGIWIVLPSSILVGTDLLRENIMQFFDMWSFYWFLGWMKGKGKIWGIVAFLLVVPAAYLHTASIAFWAAYIVIMAFWNKKEGRYKFSKKTMVLLIIGILGAGLLLFSPLKNVFCSYIGTDISLYAITHRAFDIGGSDYLQWMDCQNWLQFIPYTLIRMFYFLFAPIPQEFRGIIDFISFVTDGLLVFILLLCMLYKLCNKEKRSSICVAFVCIMALSGIFAWGVRNSGAAIRHRMLVWGILIMGSCIAMSKTKNLQNEKHI